MHQGRCPEWGGGLIFFAWFALCKTLIYGLCVGSNAELSGLALIVSHNAMLPAARS